MDQKTATIFIAVIVCILLFPLVIGIAGGVFGVLGALLGGVFGIIGGFFGIISGLIAGIFGGLFSLVGWVFDLDFSPAWPLHFDSDNIFAALFLVLVLVIATRSRKTSGSRR
jgi:hypothetical protein